MYLFYFRFFFSALVLYLTVLLLHFMRNKNGITIPDNRSASVDCYGSSFS